MLELKQLHFSAYGINNLFVGGEKKRFKQNDVLIHWHVKKDWIEL